MYIAFLVMQCLNTSYHSILELWPIKMDVHILEGKNTLYMAIVICAERASVV